MYIYIYVNSRFMYISNTRICKDPATQGNINLFLIYQCIHIHIHKSTHAHPRTRTHTHWNTSFLSPQAIRVDVKSVTPVAMPWGHIFFFTKKMKYVCEYTSWCPVVRCMHMCMCTYICIFTCAYAHGHIHVRIFIRAEIDQNIHANTKIWICIQRHVRIHIPVHL